MKDFSTLRPDGTREPHKGDGAVSESERIARQGGSVEQTLKSATVPELDKLLGELRAQIAKVEKAKAASREKRPAVRKTEYHDDKGVVTLPADLAR